jgi:mono/diheme cytochrome c family protein
MVSAFLRCLLPLLPLAAPAIIVVDRDPASAADPPPIPGVSEPAPPVDASPAVVKVYRASCLKCHDTDGKGEIVRDVNPKVPDFTDAAWHATRSDADLSRSILEGKGKSMPRMRDKVAPIGVGQMVAFVRAFRGGQQVVEESGEEPSPPEPAPAAVQPAGPAPPAARPAGPGPKELSLGEASRNFQRSCAKCHGNDGRGGEMRDSLPSIPDFTSRAWHEPHSDAQLLVSVLDGKGDGMPPFRDKVSREQARNLVAFVRSFNPSPTRVQPESPDDFEARFQQLLAEFEDLRRKSQALSADAAPTQGTPPRPSTSPPATKPR